MCFCSTIIFVFWIFRKIYYFDMPQNDNHIKICLWFITRFEICNPLQLFSIFINCLVCGIFHRITQFIYSFYFATFNQVFIIFLFNILWKRLNFILWSKCALFCFLGFPKISTKPIRSNINSRKCLFFRLMKPISHK